MNRKIVAGNWKSNTRWSEAQELLTALTDGLNERNEPCRVIVAPPMPYLCGLRAKQAGRIALAAQNCSAYDMGAFTGESTAAMLESMGVNYVICGHSERRQLFGENNEIVRQKVHNALDAGIYPILCVGESLEQRDGGMAFQTVKEQLDAALIKAVSADAAGNVIVAYEPVWAIGTGRTASAEQAGEMHTYIRTLLKTAYNDVANDIPILYGGSVKASNAAELFAADEVDGALVGGASLAADEFLAIIDANS